MNEENCVKLIKVDGVLIHEQLYNDLKSFADEQHITVANLISDFIHREGMKDE